jgi:hypothetical protein
VIGVRTLIGGSRFGARPEPAVPRGDTGAHGRVSARLADLRRLEADLERARARYERAIADYERRTRELKRRGRSTPGGTRTRNGATSGNGGNGGRLSLSAATFDDLRALGLSETQSNRVLRHRSDGNVDSVAGLETVPGIPRATLVELQRHLRD